MALSAGDANVGFLALADPIDDAAQHRHRQRHADMAEPLLDLIGQLDDVDLHAAAGRTGDDVHPAVTQFEGLQDFEANLDLFHRIGRQRDADRIPDPIGQEHPDADRGLDGPGQERARFRDAEVHGVVGLQGEQAVRVHHQMHIRGLERHLHVGEPDVLQRVHGVQGRFRQRLGRGIAVLGQKFPL